MIYEPTGLIRGGQQLKVQNNVRLLMMSALLEIEPKLVEEATEKGGHQSQKAAVETALLEYVKKLKQQEILSLFGQIDFDPEFDYKEARRMKPLKAPGFATCV